MSLEQAVGLFIDGGGGDILMVETTFDTLNARAGQRCIQLATFCEYRGGFDIPVFVSGTFVEKLGQTALLTRIEDGRGIPPAIRHTKPLCFGLNCAPGAQHRMVPFVECLANLVGKRFMHGYNNALRRHARFDGTAQMVFLEGVDENGGWLYLVDTTTS